MLALPVAHWADDTTTVYGLSWHAVDSLGPVPA